jgi:uncharacterized protein YndB with AHSA1/START domain
MDVRPGGEWKHVMHGPDGTDYPNRIVYDEVARPDRLAYRHVGDDGKALFNSTVTFEADGNRTRVTLRMVFPTAADRDFAVQKFGAVEGGQQTLARLGEYIAGPEQEDREVVCSRLFDAPREEVFRAFTDPDRLKHWWGPNGFTNTFDRFDLRPDGVWTFVMHGPDGTDYRNERVFIEVVPPERVVMENRAAPHEFRMTMIYDDRDGKTLLTWRMRFESAAELDQIRAVIVPAGEENFDRLRDLLASSRTANAA